MLHIVVWEKFEKKMKNNILFYRCEYHQIQNSKLQFPYVDFETVRVFSERMNSKSEITLSWSPAMIPSGIQVQSRKQGFCRQREKTKVLKGHFARDPSADFKTVIAKSKMLRVE